MCCESFLSDIIENILSSGFDWSNQKQSDVLGAFYYGYIFMQLPSGILATKFGAKYIFGLGVLSTGFFTLITPPAAHLGVNWLIAIRVIEGEFAVEIIDVFKTIECRFGIFSSNFVWLSVLFWGKHSLKTNYYFFPPKTFISLKSAVFFFQSLSRIHIQIEGCHPDFN